MRFVADRREFAEAAGWVSNAIQKGTDVPAVAGMLLEASEASVTLTGFNGNTMHRVTVAAEVADDGVALPSGAFLVGIVSAMKGGQVSLSMAEGNNLLEIASGDSRYKIQCIRASEYPATFETPIHVGTIDATSLAHSFGVTEHATSRNPALIALGALNIVGSAGSLVVSATDVYRIAQARANWADASGDVFTANVPAKTLVASAKGLSGSVEVATDGSAFALSDGRRTVITRCIAESEKFPVIARAFAVEPLLHVDGPRVPLIEALKRAVLVSRDGNEDLVRVSVEFSDMQIRVTALGESSEGEDVIEASAGMGEEIMTLVFSAVYLDQALSACSTEWVRFGLIAPGKQMTIAPVLADGTTDDAVRLIVMPRGRLR